ncbi:AP-3 complex subunit delta [Elasticomyces elasticus]|nr:AP-3 complex subunit delta [Elasticomyces elasticus]
MANSLLADLLPRLTHSHPAIRKKTVVTLYRLALVYPETLRPAWPKIKERLLDENEESSVTAAIINVVCELGWRRPQDFLSLAPRLFELLVQRGNNWMAIKIIKLFATLTPLEPRLVKKLLPPLTEIIKTTPAMSLLYECISGIVQGGILDSAEGTHEGDEVARLCVSKLRGMLVVEGDPNLKYVALLAFAKIVTSHSVLVAEHQDVILECIDDPDISIRARALDLVVGMVNSDNLMAIVERLLRQLRNARMATTMDDPTEDRAMRNGVEPLADPDDEEAAESLRQNEKRNEQAPPLPEDYRSNVIERILEMCSRDTYTNMVDFEWYIGVLVDLVRHCPASFSQTAEKAADGNNDVSHAIGSELLNVAVRVKSVRPEAAAAAQSLLLFDKRDEMFPTSGNGGQGVLSSSAYIAGEFASSLPDAQAVLSSLLHPTSAQLPSATLAVYLQAIPKVFVSLTADEQIAWSPSRKSTVVLLIARIVYFLEPLTLHPSLEVQERAVEYVELMRLASEAALSHSTQDDDGGFVTAPMLLTQAIPSLFTGVELNPVAPGALAKVPLPDELDLDAPINKNLQTLLQQADYDTATEDDEEDMQAYYYEAPSTYDQNKATPAADVLNSAQNKISSYQQSLEERLTPGVIARKKAERMERYRDDPFYIDSERNSGTSTPLHNILKDSNGEELNIDAIPIMDLRLDNRDPAADRAALPKPKRKPRKHFEIAADETIGGDEPISLATSPAKLPISRAKKSLLEVDSSGLSSLSLSEGGMGSGSSALDIERRQTEEEEMAKAIREVERLRLEMQRAQERVAGPEEGTVVKRKKSKKAKVELGSAVEGDDDGTGSVVRKKKKKKKKGAEDEGAGAGAGEDVEGMQEPVIGAAEPVAKAKRKKKRQVTFEEG